jgi:hypothetical protein
MARMLLRERLVGVLHSSPVLCTTLGLRSLARLATCSKNIRTTIHTVLARENLGLLDYAIDTARCSEQQQQVHQNTQAAAWLAGVLLRKVPAITAQVNERLPILPLVPLTTAKQLVAAGVRITYAQLLGAARTMVAGVEVWVHAQQQLGITTDIPALAVLICCGDDGVSGCSTQSLTVTSCCFALVLVHRHCVS